MRMRLQFSGIALLVVTSAVADVPAEDVVALPGAHAHNDYHHPRPLLDALAHGFCSVEADVFLVEGELLIGHDRSELRPGRTLTSLYLEPLRQRIRKMGGSVYGGARLFTLLVDVKSEAEPAYRALRGVLAEYADILTVVDGNRAKPGGVTVVVSGNRAWDLIAADDPRYCAIDGRLSDLDSDAPAHLLPLLSDRWTKHFEWRGSGPLADAEAGKLKRIVARAHEKGRRIRFWATPEEPTLWRALENANVDLIGADKLAALQSHLLDARAARTELKLTYESSQPLPEVRIDGAATRIHTQGLIRTQQHTYITGRLETQPRRPVLLRFNLHNPNAVETVSLTQSEALQDHPGGFDSDGKSLWIPIAESRPNSTTTVVQFPLAPNQPLAASRAKVAFTVNDHIGALAVDRTTGRLYGANWDTQVIYVWARDGSLIEKIPRERLLAGRPEWALAVQDWKSLGRGRILAGGIDKSAARDPEQSRAVVDVLNLPMRRSDAMVRLPAVPGFGGTPTHEGLAYDGTNVWLVPADLNAGALLHQYSAEGLSTGDLGDSLESQRAGQAR